MRATLGILTILLALGSGVALAQDTGGSIGGGDWGGGGGGGDYSYSGGGSDYSSSTDYSYSGGGSSSTGSSSGGGGGGGGADGWTFLLFVGVAGAWFVGHVIMSARSPIGSSAEASVDAGADADVTAIRIALDARVRPFVQKELDRIAKHADTATQEGLATTLHEVALLLRRLRDAWVYGGAYNEPMRWKHLARAAFQQHVAQARGTFRHEVVRNADGTTTTAAAPARAARGDEGPGLVLVTLIVAARQELFTVQRIGNGDDLRRALEVLTALTAPTLIAVEIVWTPADPADRMSSVELEALLPDAVFPIQGAMVGKVVCAYCAGPFPAELLSCPHCGAPARDAA